MTGCSGHPVRREPAIQLQSPRRTGSSAFADDDIVCEAGLRYLAGTGAAADTPPVGAVASAVLVDFAACGRASPSTALLTKRSCVGLDFSSAIGTDALSRGSTSATASVVTILVSRNSVGDNSCKSSQGGTLSASDSKSPAPPISNVYLARRPISRSTIIRSCAV